MKKRLMSKFLMGALVVLTMGVFSSCKDYDDDINANTKLITEGLKSQTDALNQAKQELQGKIDEANDRIKEAENAIKKANEDLAQAKKDLQDAIANGDKKVADDAAAALEKAKQDLNAAIAAGDDAAIAEAQKRIDAATAVLEGKIDAAKQAAIDEAQARIDAAEGRIKAYALQVAQDEAAAAAAQAKIDILAELDTQVAALNAAIGTKVSQKDFDDAIEKLATKDGLNEALKPVLADIAALQTLVSTKADQTTVDAIQARLNEIYGDYLKKADKEALETAIAVLGTRIEGVEGGINELTPKVTKNTDDIAVNAAAITALQQTVNQITINYATIEYVDGKIQTLNNELSTEIAKMALKSELEALELTINAALANKADKTALENAISAINTTIESLATKTELQSEVSAINTTLGELAAALQNVYTKGETDTAIADAKLALQLQINDLSGDVSNLQDAIRALEEVTLAKMNEDLLDAIGKVDGKVESILGIIDNLATTADVDSKIEALKNTMSGIYATQSDLTTLTGRVGVIEDELAGMTSALNSLADELSGLSFEDISLSRLKVGATATTGVDALVNLLRTMAANINDIYAKINGVYDFFNAAIDGVTTKINNITLFIDHNLTSIVFRPSNVDGDDAWLYGFPKIDADIIAAQSTYSFTTSGKNNTYKETANASNAQSGYAFELTAQYWLNPSTTDWTNYSYSFDEIATKNLLTRSNQDYNEAGFKYVKADSYKDGVLTVKFQFDLGENVNDAKSVYTTHYSEGYKDGDYTQDENGFKTWDPSFAWVTTVALQATRNNTETDNAAGLTDKRVVTSDYAIIAPTYIQNLLLGNNKYANTGHGVEGNNQYHLRTVYDAVKTEDASGTYSFELDLDDTKGLELNKFVDVHYNNCSGVWTNAAAQNKGFTFKYTLLVNDDVWDLTGDKLTIKQGMGIAANTGNDKAAIVRVELIANGKTYAYGYISVLMKNKQTTIDIEIPELVLKCEYDERGNQLPFAGTYAWAELISKIKTALGKDIDWTLADFVAETAAQTADENEEGAAATAPNAGPYKKFANANAATADNVRKGAIEHVEDNLAWSFTHDEAIAAFYNTDGITPADTKDYATIIKIEPNEAGKAQGVAPIVINVKIGKVVYPEASFGFDQRILRYWFVEQGDENSDDPEGRYEVHGSVEVYGQANANDEFDYDFSATFRQNRFVATPADGFDYSENNISAFFDASKYYVLPEAGLTANKLITDAMLGSKKATTIAVGASGARYLLYLKSADDNVLRAIKENANGQFRYKNSQEVVVLSGTDATKNISNFIATFQKYTYFDASNKDDYAYAYDLLNTADHKVLKGDAAKDNIVFTSHMILRITDYCLPVKYTNEGNKFDIRYLRPISIDNLGDYTVYDAVDGAYDENGNLKYNSQTMIYLADIVKFIDWRDVKFAVNNDGMKYVNYYGIKAIHPNFEEAQCDLDGKYELISEVTDKLKFDDNTIGESALRAGRTAKQFRDEIGYFLYENNSSVVETFHIKLPITIEYHWGVTAPENITITVIRTKANARQK